MSLKYAIFKICPKLARNDIHVKQESVPPMDVLDSSFIKALGVKSAGLKKIFLVFQDTLLHSFTFFGSLQVLQLKWPLLTRCTENRRKLRRKGQMCCHLLSCEVWCDHPKFCEISWRLNFGVLILEYGWSKVKVLLLWDETMKSSCMDAASNILHQSSCKSPTCK